MNGASNSENLIRRDYFTRSAAQSTACCANSLMVDWRENECPHRYFETMRVASLRFVGVSQRIQLYLERIQTFDGECQLKWHAAIRLSRREKSKIASAKTMCASPMLL